MTSHSVSQWLAGLRSGDAEAAQQLWNRFAERLVQQARRKLGDTPRSMADEEDIAQGVFYSLYRGAAAGRFNDVQNRDELWWLLLAITKQKVVDQVRKQLAKRRGVGREKLATTLNAYDSGGFSFDDLISDAPTPEYLVMLADENRRLLSLLPDDRLRVIATARIEGYTVPEIAKNLDVSTRTVERKLQLIRDTWTEDMNVAR